MSHIAGNDVPHISSMAQLWLWLTCLTVNPLVYTFHIESFRQLLKKTICCSVNRVDNSSTVTRSNPTGKPSQVNVNNTTDNVVYRTLCQGYKVMQYSFLTHGYSVGVFVSLCYHFAHLHKKMCKKGLLFENPPACFACSNTCKCKNKMADG